MRRALILRTESDDYGTFGNLTVDGGFQCYSGELPWRNNKPSVSCIPAGTYKCTWKKSPKYGDCFHVEKVKGRDNILIHAANWMGDKDKGLKCQLEGCISPGRAIDQLAGQKALLSSRDALAGLIADLGTEDFELTIRWTDELAKKLA